MLSKIEDLTGRYCTLCTDIQVHVVGVGRPTCITVTVADNAISARSMLALLLNAAAVWCSGELHYTLCSMSSIIDR
jgi:hypothetical protein